MASNPGQIPAGGKDKISVVVHTRNKGGSSLTKRFRVTTNDPQAPQTLLMVTGKVDALVEISPKRVKIQGDVGENALSEKVQIKPHKSHPFTIKEVTANRSMGAITWDLKPLGKEPPRKGYELTVSCDGQKEGRIYNVLLLKTDLKDKSVLRLPVTCVVFAKSDEAVPPAKDGKKSKK